MSTPPKTSRTARKRKAPKRPRRPKKKISATADQAVLYARSVIDDKLLLGMHLPTPDYTGPYHRLHLRSLATPMVCGTVPSASSIILNPYLLFADGLHVQKNVSGSIVTAFAPTALRTAVGTGSDVPFQPAQFNAIR